jgi:hypothetical protein
MLARKTGSQDFPKPLRTMLQNKIKTQYPLNIKQKKRKNTEGPLKTHKRLIIKPIIKRLWLKKVEILRGYFHFCKNRHEIEEKK